MTCIQSGLSQDLCQPAENEGKENIEYYIQIFNFPATTAIDFA
jgi:hypothetical protein